MRGRGCATSARCEVGRRMVERQASNAAMIGEPRPLQRVRSREDRAHAEGDWARAERVVDPVRRVRQKSGRREIARVVPYPGGNRQSPTAGEMLAHRAEIGVRAGSADKTAIAGDHRRFRLDPAIGRLERMEELTAVTIPVAIRADADGDLMKRGGSHADGSGTAGKRSCASIAGASSSIDPETPRAARSAPSASRARRERSWSSGCTMSRASHTVLRCKSRSIFAGSSPGATRGGSGARAVGVPLPRSAPARRFLS